MLRQGLARDAALMAQRAHALAKPVQIGIGVAACGGLGAGCFHRLSANMHYNARQEAARRISMPWFRSLTIQRKPWFIQGGLHRCRPAVEPAVPSPASLLSRRGRSAIDMQNNA